MKAFFVSLILMACSNLLMAQQDKIYFYYDKYGYKDVAQGRFMNLYSKEKSSKVPVFSTTMVSDKYKEEELDLISIPILEWNHQSYRCGENLESLVAFKQDFLFQKVFIETKEDHLKVGTFEIFDSYNEENRKKDSINNVKYSLHGRPVMSDNEKMEKKIYKYCWENPNVFVFMIRGLHGYWGVIDGRLVKLVVKGRDIIGEAGSEFVCKNYGEQFINDAIADCFKTGYGYTVCPDCKVNGPINIDIKISGRIYELQVRDFSVIPMELLSNLDKMGMDDSAILNEYEGKYLNFIFKINSNEFDLVRKKVGFVDSKQGYFKETRERFRRKSTPIGSSIYIFNAAQKEESGGYDAAIVYWSKFVIPIEKVIKRLKSKE